MWKSAGERTGGKSRENQGISSRKQELPMMMMMMMMCIGSDNGKHKK